ncbi:MAG: hypothetical protein KF817_09035 [Phycisphaeraceae bacterium]|nr:hypothetical protein [Phycisphaeraceae bacterium]
MHGRRLHGNAPQAEGRRGDGLDRAAVDDMSVGHALRGTRCRFLWWVRDGFEIFCTRLGRGVVQAPAGESHCGT